MCVIFGVVGKKWNFHNVLEIPFFMNSPSISSLCPTPSLFRPPLPRLLLPPPPLLLLLLLLLPAALLRRLPRRVRSVSRSHRHRWPRSSCRWISPPRATATAIRRVCRRAPRRSR